MLKATVLNEKIAKRWDTVMYDLCLEHLVLCDPYFSEITSRPDDYGVKNGITIEWMIEEAKEQLSCYYSEGNSRCEDRFLSEDEYKIWKSETGKLKRLIAALEKIGSGLVVSFEPEPEKPTKECTLQNSKQISGLHFTTKHTGKMDGMASISTSVTTNERCAKNAAIPGSICEKCFAAKQMKVFPTMEKPMVENQRILTSSILPPELLPRINNLYFRFEAFGDLNNDIQVINYFNICKKNPGVKFALWTKNPDYIAAAIAAGHAKPENLNIVLSSLFINQERRNPYDFVDKIFTVYEPEYIQENAVEINCGARNCFSCGLCYEKNNVVQIREKLK